MCHAELVSASHKTHQTYMTKNLTYKKIIKEILCDSVSLREKYK